jgi:hypothetical protein
LQLSQARHPGLRLARAAAPLGMLDCNWIKSLLARLTLIMLAALASATPGYGQAAAEYALKSSAGALSANGTAAGIGGCKVDTTVLTCLSHSYPKSTIVVIALVVLLIMRRLSRAHAARS